MSLESFTFPFKDDIASRYRSAAVSLFSNVLSLLQTAPWAEHSAWNCLGLAHQQVVAQVCLILADHFRLPTETKLLLYFAALFHDSGKILLGPDTVYASHPAPDDVRALRQLHPAIGARLIRTYFPAEIREDLATLIARHHENFDGSGYPFSLKGDQLSFPDRILRVADVFHSSLREQHHRHCRTVSFALGVLRRYSGSRFDPVVVDAINSLRLPDTVLQPLNPVDKYYHSPPSDQLSPLASNG